MASPALPLIRTRPPSGLDHHRFEWLGTGRGLLEAQLDAIDVARESVRMEMYIFADSPIGARYRETFVEIAARGVRVRILLDYLGSFELPRDYFAALDELPGAEVRWFNERRLSTLSFRDHRKIIVVDDDVAFVGGANIGTEYCGDGVTEGWRDGGIGVRGPVVEVLAAEFDAQFDRAHRRPPREPWSTRRRRRRVPSGADVTALFLAPGLGRNAFRDAFRRDLRRCRDVSITCGYFLPSRSLVGQLAAVTARGGRVRLILAGKSDVTLMQLAGRSLYRRMLRRKIEIQEYQPQILHAKIFVLDDIVYVGSANLDPRSLRINYEVMLRIRDVSFARIARSQFESDLTHSRPITIEDLRGQRTWWVRLKQKLALWVLGRLDPLVADWQIRRWRTANRPPEPESRAESDRGLGD
jgi:cardiolipin synthase